MCAHPNSFKISSRIFEYWFALLSSTQKPRHQLAFRASSLQEGLRKKDILLHCTCVHPSSSNIGSSFYNPVLSEKHGTLTDSSAKIWRPQSNLCFDFSNEFRMRPG